MKIAIDPLATTTATAKRFKVAENDYERKITLSKDGKNIDTLFIGTSPIFRKVHARQKDEESVYAVKFNDYVLKPSHREEYFKVDDWVVDGIKGSRDATKRNRKQEVSFRDACGTKIMIWELKTAILETLIIPGRSGPLIN